MSNPVLSLRLGPNDPHQERRNGMAQTSAIDDRPSSLQKTLTTLNGTSSDILASALVSLDGLIIASALMIPVDEDTVGAMSAAMLSFGGRVADEFTRGTLEQILIKGESGYVLLTKAGEDAVLCVITNSMAKLGLIFLECKRTSVKLSEALD
jgi:predicted regulator of Ras-like GTPase activity (Roadblock/LC7/MglB family)